MLASVYVFPLSSHRAVGRGGVRLVFAWREMLIVSAVGVVIDG